MTILNIYFDVINKKMCILSHTFREILMFQESLLFNVNHMVLVLSTLFKLLSASNDTWYIYLELD
jgi:hypothetical protein